MIDSLGTFLAGAEKFYLFLAVLGSVFFIYQLICALLGGGYEDGGDDIVDHGADGVEGLKFLSIKGVVSFITFFGWAGFFWGGSGWPGFCIALLCGCLMMALTAVVLFLLLKMQQSGNVVTADYVGRSGVVYLTVPPARCGYGQVTVTLPNCTRTVKAVADLELKSGTPVKIVQAVSDTLFLVEKNS